MKRLLFACLLLAGCNEPTSEKPDGRNEAPPDRPNRPVTRVGGGDGAMPPSAQAKLRDRSDSGRREAPLASLVPGKPGHVISPYSGKVVDIRAFEGLTEIVDPSFSNPREKTFRLPTQPVARPVPGKPGFVFSPFNNKIIEVKDIPSGTLVADPAYPAEEAKFFRVP